MYGGEERQRHLSLEGGTHMTKLLVGIAIAVAMSPASAFDGKTYTPNTDILEIFKPKDRDKDIATVWYIVGISVAEQRPWVVYLNPDVFVYSSKEVCDMHKPSNTEIAIYSCRALDIEPFSPSKRLEEQ
jgi:hypothetical protein